MNTGANKAQREFDSGTLPGNPLELFQQWLQEALLHEVQEPWAMTLATVDGDGMPHARVVYLRDLVDEGFIFYTNYGSDKSVQLSANPNAALNFHWPELDRQVRVCGKAEKVPAELSDLYFSGRARESRIGAWASPQSKPIPDRQWLLDEVKRIGEAFSGKEVPRPPHWGGFLIRPLSVEFWTGRTARLHDRILYRLEAESWQRQRLAP